MRRFGRLMLVTAAVFVCAGCQTFSLSEEDFEKQRRGEQVDPRVGNAVAVGGNLGVLAAEIAGAAGAWKK